MRYDCKHIATFNFGDFAWNLKILGVMQTFFNAKLRTNGKESKIMIYDFYSTLFLMCHQEPFIRSHGRKEKVMTLLWHECKGFTTWNHYKEKKRVSKSFWMATEHAELALCAHESVLWRRESSGVSRGGAWGLKHPLFQCSFFITYIDNTKFLICKLIKTCLLTHCIRGWYWSFFWTLLVNHISP